VTSSPSQTAGLNASDSNKPYFGVFLASLDNDNSFDVSYLFEGKSLCKAYIRNDNSSASWISNAMPVNNKLQRSEFVKDFGTAFTLNLGNDLTTCTNQEVILDTKITDPDVSFLWSTGQTTSNIKVNLPGKYWVKAENNCGIATDTLMIKLVVPPPSFSLGDDETLCEFDPKVLKPYANSAGYQFTWQDNSTGDSFLAKNFGVYSVKVENECGQSADMIMFSPAKYELPELTNVITPNGDLYNEYFVVEDNGSDYGQMELLIVNRWGKQVYFSDDYKNDWNGGGFSSGVYFYTLYGTCINKTKGSLSIVR
jgi:gliding motility-associated-like protein